MKKVGFMQIPKEIKIGGENFTVEFVDRTGGNSMGSTDYAATHITIAKNVDMTPTSKSSMQGTFFHELVHAMLEELGEYKLNANERFVQSFSSILNQVTQQIVEYNEVKV